MSRSSFYLNWLLVLFMFQVRDEIFPLFQPPTSLTSSKNYLISLDMCQCPMSTSDWPFPQASWLRPALVSWTDSSLPITSHWDFIRTLQHKNGGIKRLWDDQSEIVGHLIKRQALFKSTRNLLDKTHRTCFFVHRGMKNCNLWWLCTYKIQTIHSFQHFDKWNSWTI